MTAASLKPILRAMIFLSEYANAATRGSKIAHSKFIEPGLIINKTPIIPTTSADHRRNPTLSFRINADSAVIINGATKKIAEAFASGMEASAEKKHKLAKTTQKPPIIWSKGLRVLNAFQPPSKGKKTARVKISAITALNRTTSCNGINSVKYFIAISFTENDKPANSAQKILNFTL